MTNFPEEAHACAADGAPPSVTYLRGDPCRAFVPTAHLPSKSKLKVGQEVRGRVLERDAAAKKTVMTLKKALIGSKLPALTHLEVLPALALQPAVPYKLREKAGPRTLLH